MNTRLSVAGLAAEIDLAVSAPVLVIGSVPPAARDLDLVARAPEFSAIGAHLADRGFLRWRSTWASFTADGAYAVELFQADAWGLGLRSNGDQLFTGIIPIPGFQHLARPAPHVTLVLISQSMARRRGQLSAGALKRAEEAASTGDEVWMAAAVLAVELHLSGPLAMLRRRLADTRTWSRGRRLGELGRAFLVNPPSGRLPLARILAPSRWRPLLVSISGPDGSGKSTQAALLRETLRAVGVESGTAWVPTTTKRPHLPTPLRSLADGWRRPLSSTEDGEGSSPPLAHQTAPPHVRIAEHLWITSVGVANAAKIWGAVWHGRADWVLVLDRFVLDADVKLTYWYELRRGANVGIARRVFRAICPPVDVAVLLSVAPETNYERRADEWPLGTFQDFQRLYATAAVDLGAVVLDAERSIPEVAREVARATWLRLP